MIVDTADVRSPKVRFDHWRFRVTVAKTLNDGERYESIRRAVVGWYRDRAAERLPNVVERWWPQLGRGGVSQILIRDQRQRWGSCAPDGTLRINWRAMMLKPALIEYVVVHELAHLTHRNPLDGLLGPGFQGDAGCAAAAEESARDGAGASHVTLYSWMLCRAHPHCIIGRATLSAGGKHRAGLVGLICGPLGPTVARLPQPDAVRRFGRAGCHPGRAARHGPPRPDRPAG